MSLIDSHVHVWDPRLLPYLWLEGSPVDKPMLPTEIDRAEGATTGTVFVQASDAEFLAEVRWVTSLDWPDLIAIVAGADLSADADAVRHHLAELATVDLVAGVRHNLQDFSAGTLSRVAEGLAIFATTGGVFDACIRRDQLPELLELVGPFPSLRIVLDHLGNPPVDEPIRSPAGIEWSEHLARLAARPETFVKISGLTGASRDRAAFEAHADAYIAHAVATFGASRCMIGSDWPVSSTFGVGGTLGAWMRRVRRVAGDDDWPAVAAGTAAKVYVPGRMRGPGTAGS